VIGYRLVSYGFLAARTGLRPLVLAGQGQYLTPPGGPFFSESTVRYALSRADFLHAWSRPMADRMIELGADPSKILVRPRGISLGRWSPGEGRAGRPTLVSTRELEPYYNQQLLIEAARELVPRIPDLELVICGSGSDEPRLRTMAASLGLEKHVRFTGFLQEPEMVREIQRAWVYVSAVPTDGVSASLLEAMACGCYPVVVDNRANRDWIRSPVQGALYAFDDRAALARAAADALGSERARVEASAINRPLVEKEADWDRNMRDFFATYESLAGRSAGARTGRAVNGSADVAPADRPEGRRRSGSKPEGANRT
jgi:glycosyltransferase involved in cell wall biosynthesis